MNEADQRAAICAEAVSWEFTPYHDHARIKGVGADCAQFPIGVYLACGLIPDMRPVYSSQWMMHRDEELYLAEIRRFARDIPLEQLKPGDLCVWRYGRVYSHSAIVLEPPIVIHATVRAGRIVRADMTGEEDLKRKPKLAFSLFDDDGQLLPSCDAARTGVAGEIVPLSETDAAAGFMARGDYGAAQ